MSRFKNYLYEKITIGFKITLVTANQFFFRNWVDGYITMFNRSKFWNNQNSTKKSTTTPYTFIMPRQAPQKTKFFPPFFQNTQMFFGTNGYNFFPHRSNFDHVIEFHPKMTPFFGILYNFAKTELKIFKDYIDTNFKSNFIKRFNNRTKIFISFVKKMGI